MKYKIQNKKHKLLKNTVKKIKSPRLREKSCQTYLIMDYQPE